MTAGFYFPLAIRSLMAEIPIIILRTNPVINTINRPADFLPEASFIRSNMEFFRLLLSFQIKWIIISDQFIKHEINQVQAQNSLYNLLYLRAAMNEFKPALLRKTAKWRLTQRKNPACGRNDAHSLDYQPRSRTIFLEDSKAEPVEKVSGDREALRKRRKQVDCLSLAKERAELMLFWATMKHKESDAIDIKEIGLMKTQNSVTLRAKNPSFRISFLKDEISRVVLAHRKTLSARNPIQITEPIQLKSPSQVAPIETKVPSSRLRLASIKKWKVEQAVSDKVSYDFDVSGWKTTDEPWLY